MTDKFDKKSAKERERRIDKIDAAYNADNDIGNPQVTWVDYELLDLIYTCLKRIDVLEGRIEELETSEPAK